TATATDTAVTLMWKRGSGGQPEWYTITGATGTVIDRVGAEPDGSAPPGWTDLDLTNGTAYTYEVSAGNVDGESPPAGPLTVTPHAVEVKSISGKVFNDLNDDDVFDSCDSSRAGWAIWLHKGRHGYDSPIVATSTTDADGDYSFGNLATSTSAQ